MPVHKKHGFLYRINGFSQRSIQHSIFLLVHLEIDLIGFGIPGFYPSERFDFCACTAGGEDTMTSLLSKKLFFSMTYDFLTVYIPQDSASSKTVKTYRDGLTIFRRYVAEVKGFSIRSFSFSQCTFECCHVQYRRNRKSQQSECVPVSLHSTTLYAGLQK